METAAAMATVSLPALLLVGWASAAGLLVLGWKRHSELLAGSGEFLAGLMLAATPEVLYVYQAYVNGGILVAHVDDLLALGLLGMAGGLLAMLGLGRAWARPAPRPRRPVPLAAPPAKR